MVANCETPSGAKSRSRKTVGESRSSCGWKPVVRSAADRANWCLAGSSDRGRAEDYRLAGGSAFSMKAMSSIQMSKGSPGFFTPTMIPTASPFRGDSAAARPSPAAAKRIERKRVLWSTRW